MGMCASVHKSFDKYSRKFLGVIVLVTMLLALLASTALTANNHLAHWLWVNNDTRNAQDFQLVILPGNASNGNGTLTNYVAGWLGANVATGSATDFIQVGTIADGLGVRWFAFTDATAYCFRGASQWGGKGCVGAYNDHVGVNQWSRFELVNYGRGFWIARVWDQSNHPVDIAKLYITQTAVNQVYADSEQAFGTPGLQLNMSFWYYNPQYMKWGTGFKDWPAAADLYQNWFQVVTNPPVSWCPPYGYQVSSSSLRFWYMGKNPSPTTCLRLLTF
jgi:hypothetical protein